jgi:hypothetical protein
MRIQMLTAGALAALATAGLAVGMGLDGTRSAKAVVGTFTATTVSDLRTRTCTTTDGKTIAWTRARYRGAASGDSDLAGPITLDVRSVINTTDAVGTVEGRLRIDVASGGDTVAHFLSVYDRGKAAGIATGHVQDPHAKLVANLSAGFSVNGGFTDGKLGNSTGGAAVELGPARCRPDRDDDERETSEAEGRVSALSQTSITVGGLTCAIPSNLAARVNDELDVGNRAEIRCQVVAGQNTLVRFKRDR